MLWGNLLPGLGSKFFNASLGNMLQVDLDAQVSDGQRRVGDNSTMNTLKGSVQSRCWEIAWSE